MQPGKVTETIAANGDVDSADQISGAVHAINGGQNVAAAVDFHWLARAASTRIGTPLLAIA